jgi:hypothetical protein
MVTAIVSTVVSEAIDDPGTSIHFSIYGGITTLVGIVRPWSHRVASLLLTDHGRSALLISSTPRPIEQLVQVTSTLANYIQSFFVFPRIANFDIRLVPRVGDFACRLVNVGLSPRSAAVSKRYQRQRPETLDNPQEIFSDCSECRRSEGILPTCVDPVEEDVDRSNPDDVRLLRENVRRETFHDWTSTGVEPRDLAKDGLFYTGRQDQVQCVFCRGVLAEWTRDLGPVQARHKRCFPHCTFVRGIDLRNIPCDENGDELWISDRLNVSDRSAGLVSGSLHVILVF